VEVYKEHQGKGIGNALAKACIKRAKENGWDLYWNCWEDNVPSHKTAERAGFRNLKKYQQGYFWFDHFDDLIVRANNALRTKNYDLAVNLYEGIFIGAEEGKAANSWIWNNIGEGMYRANCARAWAALGRPDVAFEHLEKGGKTGFKNWTDVEETSEMKNTKNDPRWKKLRNE